MSFTARRKAYLIGAGDAFTSTPALVDEVPEINEEGWDRLTLTYAARRATLTAEECAALFPTGAQIGTRKFWILSCRPRQVAPGYWTIEVPCKGWAATKPAKIQVMTTSEEVTSAWQKFSAHNPGYRISYLTENCNAAGATINEVGKIFSLPADVVIDPPDVVNFNLAQELIPGMGDTVTWHYRGEAGFRLTSSEQDRIPGTAVGLVTDTYEFRPQWYGIKDLPTPPVPT